MELRIDHIGYQDRILVRDIGFSVSAGECLLLAGPNGSGKSTLLRRLAAEPSLANCVLIPTGIPKVKGFSVREFIRTGCYKESDWAGRLKADTRKRLEEALGLMGLKDLADRDISTLSDGEFQKACIATGLARQARLLLLDEPTAFLDVENRLMVLRTLREVAGATGTAVLFSSHDLQDSLQVAHRVLAITPEGRFLESRADNRVEVLETAFPALRPGGIR